MDTFNDNQEIEIDLWELLRVLLKKWWILVSGAVVGAVIAFLILSFLITPKYESSAVIYVLSKTTSLTSFADIQIGNALAEDYLFISTSKPVIDRAVRLLERQGLQITRNEIAHMISVTSAGTRMIKISITATDPDEAFLIANAVTHAAVERIEEVTKTEPPSEVELAEVPLHPLRPSVRVEFGALIGLFLAAAVLVLQFVMNDHIKTEEDVKKYLGLNTLVVLPFEGK